MSVELRCSDTDQIKRDIPSFIEPRPPLILNPFMRPRPQKGVNLLELFEEDSVSDESEWVKVYLRLKPCEHPNPLYDIKSDRHFISSVDTATAGHGRRTLHNISKMYTFSHIFGPQASQKEIFDRVVKDNLKKLPDGHNFTLLTYGASGSGKTYTLMGTASAPGLVPRSLEYVFKVVDAAQQPLYKPADNGAEKLSYHQQEYELQVVKRFCNVSKSFRDKYRRASTQVMNDFGASTFDLSNRTKYYVWVSFVEIYNEKIYDLLTNCDRNKSTSKLQIREDSNGNVYVKGATQAFVRSGEEAYDIMVTAKYNLQVAATGIHAHSSRSHCIFTITMLTETDCSVRPSYVRLCDLAGCERLRQTRNTGARMVESRAINSSLHVLERCLRMLKRKQRHREDATIVPYRESKLTRLLGAGLSGARNEAVTMVVALNPAPHCTDLNRHVLQLATVAKDIQVNSTIAESTLESNSQDGAAADDLRYELMKLREENERLHFELAQAESCISELQATMDEKQKESAKTMYEIVEEAKDITREYYEAQIQSLRAEMEEMREEYEYRLKAVTKNPEVTRFSSELGTPSRQLLQKTKQLETVLALKEEELEDSRLARARLEAEVQRLLACIEERDQETGPSEHEEILSCEESAEVDESDDEQLEVTFKETIDVSHDKTLETSDDATNNGLTDVSHNKTLETLNASINKPKYENFDLDGSLKVTMNANNEPQSASVRGTYLFRINDTNTDKAEGNESYTNHTTNNGLTDVSHNKTLETLNASNNKPKYENFDLDDSLQVTMKANNKTQSAFVRGTYFVRKNDTNTDEAEGNESLKSSSISNSNKGTYYVETMKIENTPNAPLATKSKNNKQTGEYFFEKPNANDLANHEVLVASNGSHFSSKKPISIRENGTESIFPKTVSVDECDISLAQFEQLEKDTKSEEKSRNCDVFKNIKFLKGNRHIFDEDSRKNSEDLSINNGNLLGDDRSPSIVKDEVRNDFEPDKIKSLFGDSFTKPDILSTVILNNKIAMPKKNASIDIFEVFDSPKAVLKPNEDMVKKLVGTTQYTEKDENSQCDTTEYFKSTKKNCFIFDKIDRNKKLDEDFSEMLTENSQYHKQDEKGHRVTTETDGLTKKHGLIFDKVDTSTTQNKDLSENHVGYTQHSKRDENTRGISTEIGVLRNKRCLIFDKMNKDTNPNSNLTEKLIGISQCSKKNEMEQHFTTENAYLRKEQDLIFGKTDTNKNIVFNKCTEESNDLSIKKRVDPEKATSVLAVAIEKKKDKCLNSEQLHHEFLVPKGEITSKKVDEKGKTYVHVDTVENNTIVEFENIYKNLSTPNASAFDKLLLENTNMTVNESGVHNKMEETDLEQSKYNLRDKKNNDNVEKQPQVEMLLESEAKCDPKPPKRQLRLRRRKNATESENNESSKLRDIGNLQSEYSDVTMDKPAPAREARDIPSPEKIGEEENLLPQDIQSCTKSVTRSRRKLYTPRAEPLEESVGDDSVERVRVPRPSYHRPRARRKL